MFIVAFGSGEILAKADEYTQEYESLIVTDYTDHELETEGTADAALVEADHQIAAVKIDREEKLRNFFSKYNSPLADSAETFVAIADKYNIDYRLLPAISGVESTFCRNIIQGTYNCYGWGIYGNNVIYFDSFDDGIQKVGQGIYEGYVTKGADSVEKIAPIYNPNTPWHWSGKVRFFMNQII